MKFDAYLEQTQSSWFRVRVAMTILDSILSVALVPCIHLTYSAR